MMLLRKKSPIQAEIIKGKIRKLSYDRRKK